MQAIKTEHPPGAVVMVTSELTRYGRSMMCLMELQAAPGSAVSWHQGVLIAESLNAGLASFMKHAEYEWAWIMGDDHTYDPTILVNLLSREKEVILPICVNRMPPYDPPIVVHGPEGGNLKFLEEMPTSGLYRLADNETCGDAGLLLRRRAVEKTGPPWYEQRRTGTFASDDQAFTAKLKEAGFDVWIDCDHPIGHIGPITYVPVVRDGKWRIHLASSLTPVVELLPQRRRVR